ncbi:hypothetical protein CXG81DRAFT_12583 [Caulochytrium protostelioides]|uniref:Dihydrofolate reductase n=1 Tax=Caulochytrium protostelioides TaxID=1555241 RepID=A0A4P9X7N9_9FUNG|nr:hypothetical protein CXG81DRAFT_12583 [Caulochytrium protostelioides]|eukprot:RKP00971.1 hypothetical protein CXG81DRAFT_12583 [Caulochytrium protostelioides]
MCPGAIATPPAFALIVAHDAARGIGRHGTMPWRLPPDMAFFAAATRAAWPEAESTPKPPPPRQNAVVMGRKTWESIPPRFRPLPGRLNVVVSRSAEARAALPDGVLGAGGLDSAFAMLAAMGDWYPWLPVAPSAATPPPPAAPMPAVFVIGGAQLYAASLREPQCRAALVTAIEQTFPCDVFFPDLAANGFAQDAASSEHAAASGELQGAAASVFPAAALLPHPGAPTTMTHKAVTFAFTSWHRISPPTTA